MFREELSQSFQGVTALLPRAVRAVIFTQATPKLRKWILSAWRNDAILKLGPAPHRARLGKHSRRAGGVDRLRNVGPAGGRGERLRGPAFAGFSPCPRSSCPNRVAGRTGCDDR